MQIDEHFLNLIKLIEFRRDYNQSNGGNISYKRDDKIFIKPSGVHMGQLREESDFFCDTIDKFNTFLNQSKLGEDLDNLMDQFTQRHFCELEKRPSIETVLHTQLNRFTVHLHSVSTTILSCKKGWQDVVRDNFPGAICLDYYHPGIELGLQLKEAIKGLTKKPEVIFLQNHGILISTNDCERLYDLTIDVHQKADSLINYKDNLDMVQAMPIFEYIRDNHPKLLLHSSNYKLSDEEISTSFLTPDVLIHCGAHILDIKDISQLKSDFDKFQNMYNKLPHLICFDNNLYILAQSRSKALEIEEVFSMQVKLMKSIGKEELLTLSQTEIDRIVHWKPGKWRRK